MKLAGCWGTPSDPEFLVSLGSRNRPVVGVWFGRHPQRIGHNGDALGMPCPSVPFVQRRFSGLCLCNPRWPAPFCSGLCCPRCCSRPASYRCACTLAILREPSWRMRSLHFGGMGWRRLHQDSKASGHFRDSGAFCNRVRRAPHLDNISDLHSPLAAAIAIVCDQKTCLHDHYVLHMLSFNIRKTYVGTGGSTPAAIEAWTLERVLATTDL